jgi:UPF0755 protein
VTLCLCALVAKKIHFRVDSTFQLFKDIIGHRNNMSKFADQLKSMKRSFLKYLIPVFAGAIVILMTILYITIFSPGIIPLNEKTIIYIPTGSTYTGVKDSIRAHFVVKNWKMLELISEKKNYPRLIKPGKYQFDKSLSYPSFINLLRAGRQTPVKVTFSNIRTLNQLAGKIGSQIEADSSQILSFFNDRENYKKEGFSRENVISVFIPNTYELLWNTSPGGLFTRMLKEYNKFWNDERLAKAREQNLSRSEVAILASIIDDEVVKADEKPRIAGVYLNRIKRGIPLQACPTIKFALNDFTITRVLYKYLQVDSPYNTYKHNGFPPGPIGCPTIEGIDAVLNAEKHDFLFFAARADFSGYHNFSRTLSEHNRYAALYQKELDKRKIFK